jgi:peptidoglycan-associated lipoprotein
MNARWVPLLAGIGAALLLQGCSVNRMALKKGDKRFKYGEYELAIDQYRKALEKPQHTAEANFKIGESYRLSNRLRESEPYYSAALSHNTDAENARFYYGLALKANEKYDESRASLETFLSEAREEASIDLARKELDNLDKIRSIMERPSFFRVRNLSGINTPAAEYCPVYRENELYWTSSRDGGKIYKATGTAFTDIYKAKTQGARVDTTNVQALSDLFNDPDTHEGCVAFSPDGQVMVFAKGNSGRKKGADDVDLYLSRFRRSGWSKPEPMRINDPAAWDSSPAFSGDGRTLYFASNRRGGYGGTDLYMATLNRRGNFSSPQNMGPIVNTAGNEAFPHQGADGALYFSSDGHPGLGGLDLFVATRSEGMLKIENMGAPVNSSSDDFALYLYSPDRGFFSSNREGGVGDDDIYTFINNDPDLKIVNYFLAGTTVTYDDSGAEVVLPGTVVQLIDARDELLGEAVTGREGEFRFRVYPEENYILRAEKTEFFTTRAAFSTIGETVPKEQLTRLITNKTFATKLALDRIELNKTIVLENIYYDLDKWDIRPDAALELDKLVTVLQDNPEIKIELSSHTDSRATADYNLDLSRKRAQSAVDYIVTRGIDRSRMVAQGYGESQLIISDEEIARLPTEEEQEAAHQRNRRTEFKVTEYVPVAEAEETGEEEVVELEAERRVEPGTNNLEDRIDWDN